MFKKIKFHPFYLLLIHASAPYFAVLLGLYVFRSGWISIFLYHIQIVIYSCIFKKDLKKILFAGFSLKYFLLFVFPLLLFGPVLYRLFPHIITYDTSFQEWLYNYGLDHRSYIMLIPYFCIVHPVLEEIHWGKFRDNKDQHWTMHFLFAGYHILVLGKILSLPWILLSFSALVLISCVWTALYNNLKGGLVPLVSHTVADVATILSTYYFVFK